MKPMTYVSIKNYFQCSFIYSDKNLAISVYYQEYNVKIKFATHIELF